MATLVRYNILIVTICVIVGLVLSVDGLFPYRHAHFMLDTGEILIEERHLVTETNQYRERTALSVFIRDWGVNPEDKYSGGSVLLYSGRWQRKETGFADVPTSAQDIVRVVYMAEEKARENPIIVSNAVNAFMEAVQRGEATQYRGVAQKLEIALK